MGIVFQTFAFVPEADWPAVFAAILEEDAVSTTADADGIIGDSEMITTMLKETVCPT